MATWEARRVSDVVQDIHDGRIVLPVIQRRLVWDESKMELLFDSLLKGNSFGGIMVLQEAQGNQPLFAFRRFSREGEELASSPQAKLGQKTFLIIDGQQRLQSFYMGLQGGINDKQIYFNLLGHGDEYEFRFAYQEANLPTQEPDDAGTSVKKLWYPVPALFDRLHMVLHDRQVANEIAAQARITDGAVKDIIEDNVSAFFRSIFVWQTIGLSSVMVNKTQADRERRRIVELFRRLNDGGTRLSSFDLAASMFKVFDYRMERFFRDVRQFEDMGIAQDEVIKLVFLLQDSHSKEVTDIEAGDAEFVIQNRDRIFQSLRALREFLKNARLYDYYRSRGRSVIPLYFVAYHVFHKKEVPAAQLDGVYDNYDAKNDDFLSLKRWMYLSILNGVFSRGKGWIPYRTSIRKILDTLKRYKGQVFPAEALFEVYRRHPLVFRSEVISERLDLWDRDFVFYLMYDRQSLSGRDIDHVHPKSKLEDAGVSPHKIHSIANFQLLDKVTNRKAKRAKALADWLRGGGVSDLDAYLDGHMIPKDETKWDITSFDSFLEERAQAIAEKVRSFIPEPLPPVEQIPEPPARSTLDVEEHQSLDKETLYGAVSQECRGHSILKDQTSWEEIYKEKGLNPTWTGRYRSELGSVGIETVADLAQYIMALKLEFRYSYKWGNVFRFHQPTPDGQEVELQTKSFGGWAWSAALDELKTRGFDWETFVVNPDKLREEGKQ